jgi:hypothetical protein
VWLASLSFFYCFTKYNGIVLAKRCCKTAASLTKSAAAKKLLNKNIKLMD